MKTDEIVNALLLTPSRSKRTLLNTAANEIERLADRCARYAEEIAVLQERTRWIPVEERLPDVGVDILAYYRDKHINMGSWGCDDWLEEGVEDGYITHWMPLPDGPEMDGGVDNAGK